MRWGIADPTETVAHYRSAFSTSVPCPPHCSLCPYDIISSLAHLLYTRGMRASDDGFSPAAIPRPKRRRDGVCFRVPRRSVTLRSTREECLIPLYPSDVLGLALACLGSGSGGAALFVRFG